MSDVLWNCWWVVKPRCSGLSIPQTSAVCQDLLASTMIPVGTALGRSLYSAAIILQISPRRDGSYHQAAVFCIWHYVSVAGNFLQGLVDIQWFSRVQHFVSPRTAACQFPVLHYLLKFAQTHVHWVSDAIQPFHPLPLPWWITVKTANNKSFMTEALQKDLTSHAHFRQQNLIPRSQK